MNRRELLTTGLMIGTSSALWGPFTPCATAADSKTGTSVPIKLAAKDAKPFIDLAKSTADCLLTGELCAAHCRKELANGNSSFVKCEARVLDMLALTKAMLDLAASGSEMARKLAPICADACSACSEACGEHKEHFEHGMHKECKACMEACDRCIKECQKLAA